MCSDVRAGYVIGEDQGAEPSKSKSKMVDRKGGKAVTMACDQEARACAVLVVVVVVVVRDEVEVEVEAIGSSLCPALPGYALLVKAACCTLCRWDAVRY